MSTIELREVSKRGARGRGPLLDAISLIVPDGTSLAIVGTAGSGKSLLMKIIVGVESADTGDVLMDGSLVNVVGPRDRDIAMVFQDFELHPHLDVFKNLAFSARLRKGVDKEMLSERIDAVAEFLGLRDVLDAGAKPKDLTASQRQRVALGRVLVRDAAAYLFDDALASLDERLRSQIRAMTTQWQRALGRTSVYVCSDIQEALSLGDTVAVMHQGFLHQIGTPRDLYERPRDLFVAAFVGAPAMNLMPAELKGADLELPFLTLPLDPALQDRLRGRQQLVVGIRPEDCVDATGLSDADLIDKVVFTATIDEVEWRGRSQYAYLGFDIDADTEAVLDEVEQLLEFDLFQTHVLAEVSAERELTPGLMLKVAVGADKIRVFDAVTGENLTDPR